MAACISSYITTYDTITFNNTVENIAFENKFIAFEFRSYMQQLKIQDAVILPTQW